MKTIAIISTITIISIVAVVAVVACLNALDRSVFPGCRVIDQSGRVLTIELSDELCEGTDTACERAEALINKIKDSGYSVRIAESDHWVPFANLIGTRP